MKGLREGFWPFDDGEWSGKAEEPLENYSSEKVDIEAIRAFQDKEIKARRWSDPLEIDDLLPGMKSSPLFVVWQKGKARVVTDHSASGLNDGISKSDAR
ncbi:hypothetical protein C0993_004816, partial [Termitomyces sp. T159_Od127]